MPGRDGDELTPKQRRVVQEYETDFNATQAATRAGYSSHTAKVIGSENLTKPAIKDAIEEQAAGYAEKAEIDAVWVLDGFRALHDRSTQAEPVRDKKGRIIEGQWQFDGQVAARSLENIGRHIRFFPTEARETPVQNVNVLVASTEWVQLRGVVIRALQAFPEARAAVVEALRVAEGGEAGEAGAIEPDESRRALPDTVAQTGEDMR